MQRISLFGYGVTTKAIAEKFGPFTFYDDHVSKPLADDGGNRLSPPSEFDPRYSDLEVPSPGFPPEHPLIAAASNLVSEYDLFLSPKRRPPFTLERKPLNIWITGTNGKTTTTQMTAHLLSDKGAQSGGNIGTPLALLDPAAPIWVLETSSFALHYTHEAKPDIYIVLPITPDHISWHGSERAYIDAKLSPLSRMREGETVILPRALADTPTNGHLVAYDGAEDLAAYLGIETQRLRFKGAFLLDAVLAMAADKILYDRIDYEGINAFQMDPHRQEEFHDARGRLWVNDTKATNIDATLAAVARYGERPMHLIVGGDDKGVEMTPLFEALENFDVTLYAIGSNAERLEALASRFGIPCYRAETLHNAVLLIGERHNDKSVALLSPAASSLDQFPSYAVRGEQFKQNVKALS